MGLIETILQTLFPPAPEPLAGARHGRPTIVRGRVVARDLIDSPLTGARCIYYRYLVEEWRRPAVRLGATGFWVVSDQDEAIAEFYVQDESGRAIVAPERALVALARPLAAEVVSTPSGRRATESRIAPGDLVEVEGVIEEIDDLLDERRSYRDPAVRRLLRAPDGGLLRIRLVARG